ncbi:MAG: hypothetical protein M0R51_05960 [Clostridia bacterium]|nr:hypothetical protein [Clostridia bacterium]
MTRSRKIEKAIKEDYNFRAIGEDYTDKDPAEYTNIDAVGFCPHIDNSRLQKIILSKKGEGIIHRKCVASNGTDRFYHYVQLQDFKPVQFCKLQRDPEADIEKCEKNFLKCPAYLAEMAEEKKAKKRVV